MNIYEREMAEGRLFAKTNRYRTQQQFSLAGIEAMQKIAPRSYASISFGKQSVCLAHMLYHVDPTIPMFFLASWESFLLYNYEEVIEEFTRRFPINLTIVMADNVSNNKGLSWKETRDLGQQDLQTMCTREEWDGWYWGLVEEESKGRHMTLNWKWKGQPHPTIFRYKDGKYRCCPLKQWGTLEIAAYVSTHEIPLLDLYKQNGLKMRTTARVTRDMAELGGVAYLRTLPQARLNKLLKRFPSLRVYT